MNWNKWIRQAHRCLSMAFTAAVIVNIVAIAQKKYSASVGLLAVIPLALQFLTGLYLFVLPLANKWSRARRTSQSPNEPESPELRYKAHIDQCDVVDRKRLERYREKRYEWLSWYELRKGEPNTIQQQIFSMMFLDMAYRVLASARQSAEQDVTSSAQSGLLAHFLDQGYVATQVLAIRKLSDKGKDVFSLRRLLDDMADHRDLITRENYVCYDDLPFDSDTWKAQPQGIETAMWGDEAPGLSRFLGSRVRHEMFDRLSGVPPTARQRGDLIKKEVFGKLKNLLVNSAAQRIVLLSNKFFAHAATEDSRGALAFSGIKLSDVDEIQRAFIRVERALTDELLFIAIGREVVPMLPLGMFKGLEHPYASAKSIENMDKIWDQLAEERNQWTKGIEKDIA
jgi:hypothetical protein